MQYKYCRLTDLNMGALLSIKILLFQYGVGLKFTFQMENLHHFEDRYLSKKLVYPGSPVSF